MTGLQALIWLPASQSPPDLTQTSPLSPAMSFCHFKSQARMPLWISYKVPLCRLFMPGDLNFNVVAFTIFSYIISTLREFLTGFFCMPRLHCLMHLFKFCFSCLSLSSSEVTSGRGVTWGGGAMLFFSYGYSYIMRLYIWSESPSVFSFFENSLSILDSLRLRQVLDSA